MGSVVGGVAAAELSVGGLGVGVPAVPAVASGAGWVPILSCVEPVPVAEVALLSGAVVGGGVGNWAGVDVGSAPAWLASVEVGVPVPRLPAVESVPDADVEVAAPNTCGVDEAELSVTLDGTPPPLLIIIIVLLCGGGAATARVIGEVVPLETVKRALGEAKACQSKVTS